MRRPFGAPRVIAHRGSSGYFPEHTTPAYLLAARQGADAWEPDLVMTADGMLVVRHDRELGHTTDIALRPEFASLRTTKVIKGQRVTDWFAEDLTWSQVRTLRARQPMPQLRDIRYDRRYPILSLEQLLQLRARVQHASGRTLGLVPELKDATHLRSQGLDVAAALVNTLRRHGLDRPGAPVWTESAEPTILEHLRHYLGYQAQLVLLLENSPQPADLVAVGDRRTIAQRTTVAELRQMASTIDAISPAKDLVIARRVDGTLGRPTGLVRRAHASGLAVFSWTFRAENAFLPRELRSGTSPANWGNLQAEIAAFVEAGVDGFFCDQVDRAAAVLHPR